MQPVTTEVGFSTPLNIILIEDLEDLSVKAVLVQYKVFDQPTDDFHERILLETSPHLRERIPSASGYPRCLVALM